MCEFRDDYDQYTAAGVAILPISVDATPSQKEFKAKFNLQTDFLSDFHRAVCRQYGVLHPERFFAQRAYFLIDRDGRVRWSHIEKVPSDRRPDAEILAAIRAA